MVHPEKICPRCQAIAPLSAVFCQQCGHGFRTQFAPPPTGPASPPQVAASPYLRFIRGIGSGRSGAGARLALFAAACGTILVLFASVMKTALSPSPSAYAGSPASGSLTADTIYQDLHSGMTLQEVTEKFGSPDGQQETVADGMYGGDPQGRIGADEFNARLKQQVDAVLPLGHIDSGRRLLAWYQRGGLMVTITLVGTLDNEHGISGINGPPVWVVLSFQRDNSTPQDAVRSPDPAPVNVKPPALQRSDGSFYPMAGIDYPDDATHPRGSLNHETTPPVPGYEYRPTPLGLPPVIFSRPRRVYSNPPAATESYAPAARSGGDSASAVPPLSPFGGGRYPFAGSPWRPPPQSGGYQAQGGYGH